MTELASCSLLADFLPGCYSTGIAEALGNALGPTSVIGDILRVITLAL